MDAFQIQMERAHQAGVAKRAVGELVEALRVVNTLTRALVDDDGHSDVVTVDTAHAHAQDLAAEVAWITSATTASGLPGGLIYFPPKRQV